MSGVAKRFGAVQALSDVSLAVYPGEIVALVGDNAGLAGGQRPEWRAGAAGMAAGQRAEWRAGSGRNGGRAAGGVAGRNQRAAGWRTRTRSGASTSCSRAPSSSKES
jgi:hypothetical protein